MIALEFQFTAGRFHANPWGRHVNEAEVEWPPSPWRVIRAMISVWHRESKTLEMDERELSTLVESLSEDLPVYLLPPAVHAHTRHYMPTKKTETTLVYDAFARISAKEKLIMAWPNLRLSEDQIALFKSLVEKIMYLGRAESWVSTRFILDWNGKPNCYPGLYENEYEDDGKFYQRVNVLTPISKALFERWRASIQVGHSKKGWMPNQLIDALSVTTSDLEKGRWSSPPGAQEVLYLRPEDSLNSIGSDVKRISIIKSFNVARFALGGDLKRLPKWTEAIVLGDLLHLALMGRSGDTIPSAINGRDANGEILKANHRHGFCLPEDSDGDGKIDHLIFVSRDEFPEDVLKAIRELDKVGKIWTPKYWAGRQSEWPIRLEMLGNTNERSSLKVDGEHILPLLAEGRKWVSVTPYLHPWHAKKKGKFGAEEQLRREIMQRGYPDPVKICVVHDEYRNDKLVDPWTSELSQSHSYKRRRPSHPGESAPDRMGSFLEIEFSTSVKGPIAFGFACHYGLGMFVPLEI